MRRLARILAVFALALVLAACRVDAVVEVEVADNGSGEVRVGVALDDDAVDRVGDVDRLLVTSDLAAAGWDMQDPAPESDGLTWIRASKPFAEPDELQAVLAEVSPVFDIDLDRSHAFGRTSFDVDGTIDLSSGVSAFGDQQLAELLGSRAGFDVDALEEEIGPLSEAVEVRFIVQMPFDVDANGETTGDQAVWTVQPGDEVVDVDASASQRHVWTLVWAVLATGFFVGFVAVVGRRAWRAYSGADLPPEYVTPVAAPVPPSADDDQEPARRQLELVVIDAFGVLFDVGDDVTAVLGPFVRDHGGTTDPIEVAERYRQTSLGRLSTAQLWQTLGVEGEADDLDRLFVDRLTVVDGALTFLERAKLQGLTVTCLANGVSSWFDLLRQRDSLDVYCETWIVSSELGVRKPDPATFKAVRDRTGVPLGNCLMIDDRVEHLDGARHEGMSTALFGSRTDDAGSHPRLDDFDALLT